MIYAAVGESRKRIPPPPPPLSLRDTAVARLWPILAVNATGRALERRCVHSRMIRRQRATYRELYSVPSGRVHLLLSRINPAI